jgi:hypothetical protein
MAGLGYKSFTSGAVLTASQVQGYLQDQSVMVFDTAAARTTALGANVATGMVSFLKATDTNDKANAVEIYDGSKWVSLYANNSAGSNRLLNGDFSIWQRGTSFSVTATGTYTADRWNNVFDGTAGTKTISQQTFTPGAAPVTGYESAYFLRVNQTVAGTGQTAHGLTQRIEDVRSFAGQTVTLSFWAKAAVAFTRQIAFTQYFGTGGSATLTDVVTSSFTVGTSWARYSFTVNIPSVAGKTIGTDSFLETVIALPLNSTFTFDVWGAQLEAGTIATDFNTATGNPATELAACQRYYQRFDVSSGNIGSGVIQTTTTTYVSCNFKTSMRKTPTLGSLLTGNTVKIMNYVGTQFPVTAVSSQISGTNNVMFLATTGTLTGASVGQGAMCFITGSADYLEVNAEL